MLFEIKPIDPPTLAVAATLVVLVTLGASYFPARRASHVPPMNALRHE
jgi:ABC-type lipoprotein release transport system permease subunit